LTKLFDRHPIYAHSKAGQFVSDLRLVNKGIHRLVQFFDYLWRNISRGQQAVPWSCLKALNTCFISRGDLSENRQAIFSRLGECYETAALNMADQIYRIVKHEVDASAN